jgi:uncharacterized protein YqeY
MKGRDATAVAALRSALGAIDNAEAVDPSHAPRRQGGVLAGGVAGLGTGEVARRTLSPSDVAAVLRAEVDDRRSAAGEYERLGRPVDAARLRAEAAVIAAQLDSG